MTPAYTLVVTSCNDRGHSRASFHYIDRAMDYALIAYNGYPVIWNDGVDVDGAHGGLWFVTLIAAQFTASIPAATAVPGALALLGQYIQKVTPHGFDVVIKNDHVHVEVQPKRPAIFDPGQIRATVNAAGEGATADQLDKIARAMIELRHKRG